MRYINCDRNRDDGEHCGFDAMSVLMWDGKHLNVLWCYKDAVDDEWPLVLTLSQQQPNKETSPCLFWAAVCSLWKWTYDNYVICLINSSVWTHAVCLPCLYQYLTLLWTALSQSRSCENDSVLPVIWLVGSRLRFDPLTCTSPEAG